MLNVSSSLLAVGCYTATHATATRWIRNTTISSAAAKTPSPLQHGLVFAAHNGVVLWDPQDPKGLQTMLRGHSGAVTCVETIHGKTSSGEEGFIAICSGSVDKTIRIWLLDNEKQEWKTVSVLNGHTDSLTTITISKIPIYENNYLIVSSGTDGQILIWACEINTIDCTAQHKLLQTFSLDKNYCQSLSLARLPGSEQDYILATAMVDAKVHLYTWNAKEIKFDPALKLQGHTDWVTSVSFSESSESGLFLVSASQDKLIRLWRFGKTTQEERLQGEKLPTIDDLLKSLEDSTSSLLGKKEYFETFSHNIYAVALDALLVGHEDIVYSALWHPVTENKLPNMQYFDNQPLCIISAGMDRNVMIWKPDPHTGIWLNETRVGELGGQNTLGFYGTLFDSTGEFMIAHAFNGAFHLWNQSPPHSSLWKTMPTQSGHFGPLEDVCWDPSGEYLVSVSLDQTARMFVPAPSNVSDASSATYSWHELSRPQIHGYDMKCIAFPKRHQYISGSDEKVLRVFDCPRSILQNMKKLNPFLSITNEDITNRPLGATTPALGLSNKAIQMAEVAEESASNPEIASSSQGFASTVIDDEEDDNDASNPNISIDNIQIDGLPIEGQLLQSTLWVEIDKLYGHPYEIFTVCCDHSNRYAASACKATKPEHAVIRVWDVQNWKSLFTLPGHHLTITQMSFSYSDDWLLSGSRDRSWFLFRKNTSGDGDPYIPYASCTKAHSRIIWSISFTYDDQYFATGARDKKLRIWSLEKIRAKKNLQNGLLDIVDISDICDGELDFEDSVTAVAFAPTLMFGKLIGAVGLENGKLFFITGVKDKESGKVIWDMNVIAENLCPIAEVKRLQWRPTNADKEQSSHQLAIAGADHTLRILEFTNA